jgi:hypothetical protein
MYLIDLQMGPVRLVRIQIAADEFTDKIILGRNTLNQPASCLDGPQQLTDILDDSTVQRLRAQRKNEQPTSLDERDAPLA